MNEYLFASIAIICATALAIQHRYFVFKGMDIEERITALENRANETFDPKAFEELRSKVEAMRIAQGLKGSR